MSEATMSLAALQALLIHEAAEAFPYIAADEITALAQDIESNGLAQPIILFGGLVLDGRNRLRAMAKCRASDNFNPAAVPVVEYSGTDPVGYVLSLNIHRRHMTVYDWVETAKKLAPMVADGAHERQVEAGRAVGSGSLASLDAKHEDTGKTAALVAEKLQGAVSQATLERGWAVMDRKPELWAETKRTGGSITAAFNQVPKVKQPKSVHGQNQAAAPSSRAQKNLDSAYELLKGALADMRAAAPKFAKAYTAYMKSNPSVEETDDWGRRLSDITKAIGLVTEVLDRA